MFTVKGCQPGPSMARPIHVASAAPFAMAATILAASANSRAFRQYLHSFRTPLSGGASLRWGHSGAMPAPRPKRAPRRPSDEKKLPPSGLAGMGAPAFPAKVAAGGHLVGFPGFTNDVGPCFGLEEATAGHPDLGFRPRRGSKGGHRSSLPSVSGVRLRGKKTTASGALRTPAVDESRGNPSPF